MNYDVSKLIIEYINSRADKSKIVFAALQGGFARGTANIDSDVDVLLAYDMRSDIIDENRFIEYNGKLIELRFLCFSEVPAPSYWLERTRYIYNNETQFIYGDKVRWQNLLLQCRMSEIEKMDLLVFALKRCARRGVYCKQGEVLSTQIRTVNMKINTLGLSRKSYWIDRNDYVSAKLLCSSAIEYLIVVIFALNNKFVPSPKYRYFLLQKLKWKPKSLDLLIDNIKNDVSYSYNEMQDLFCDILTECMNKAKHDKFVFDGYENYHYSTNLPLLKEDAFF